MLDFMSSCLYATIAATLPAYDKGDHTKCALTCRFHLPSQSKVVPVHGDECIQKACTDHVVDEENIIAVLREGKVPCLRLGSVTKRIKVIDTTQCEYVAISHVWSQGMGNSTTNTLPRCQLLKMFPLLKEIDPNVAPRVDTLTVPIDRVYKVQAIERLRQVYSEAKAVLVVDKCLQNVNRSPIEMNLHLTCCEWLSRFMDST